MEGYHPKSVYNYNIRNLKPKKEMIKKSNEYIKFI